jgi:hypothetical protein
MRSPKYTGNSEVPSVEAHSPSNGVVGLVKSMPNSWRTTGIVVPLITMVARPGEVKVIEIVPNEVPTGGPA